LVGEVSGERLAEVAGGRDRMLRPAEPRQRQIAEAAAHRVADEERAAEDGNGGRNTQADRQVGSPVVRRAAKD
jgi:hypothetical protein